MKIPQIGFGTWKMTGSQCEQAVGWALEAGYRHIDTAKIYRNEDAVGRGVKNSDLKRDEVWVTTKLWPLDFANPEKALHASLDRLGFDYVDLYLIHWPVYSSRVRVWQELIKLRDQGLIKNIGVSNYSEELIDELIAETGETPFANQIEISPWVQPKELIKYCRGKGIVVEAYSPLTRGRRLNDADLTAISRKYGKSPAQVLIRWSMQHGFVVLPKTAQKDRIAENCDVMDFELTATDMKALDNL